MDGFSGVSDFEWPLVSAWSLDGVRDTVMSPRGNSRISRNKEKINLKSSVNQEMKKGELLQLYETAERGCHLSSFDVQFDQHAITFYVFSWSFPRFSVSFLSPFILDESATMTEALLPPPICLFVHFASSYVLFVSSSIRL